jgi:hypothetical protein
MRTTISKISFVSLGRQAQARLVEQHQRGLGHQRAADRQHLLLAARQQPGLLPGALLQDGEVAVDHLDVARDGIAVARV